MSQPVVESCLSNGQGILDLCVQPFIQYDQKVFARFCLPYIQLPYNIRFSTYSSNILYNNFNLVLKQTHSGTKKYQKLCYILVHKILIFNNVSYNCTMKTTYITKFDHRKIYFLNNHPMPILKNCSIS